MNFKEYPDREMLAIEVANRLAGDLESSLLTHETTTLAVPGGTTPGAIYDCLCAADLAWEKVRILLTDERWVPQDNPQSNAALIRARLLTGHAAKAQFQPFFDEGKTIEEAASDLSAVLGDHGPLSVLLLGMGEDMHTASLFPGAPELGKALDPDAPMLIPVISQNTPRISLTAPILEGALCKHLVIFGAAKRAAFERATLFSPMDAPIAAVLGDLNVHWAA